MKTPDHPEKKKLLRKICRKAGVTIRDHDMIEKGDHILVGLSGGKDSLILLQVLAERKQILPFEFRITAAHISNQSVDYQIDLNKLKNFCNDLKIPFIHKIINPDMREDLKKASCFVCSWHRRKVLFDLTRELDCNKLALGHHRYDAIETLLLNMIYHGSISSLPYALRMFDGRVTLIRPLLDLDENLLTDYAEGNEIVAVEKACEYEGNTKRKIISDLIMEIEKVYSKGSFNIFKSMGKIFEEYLPQAKARVR